jgi:hypothetical protein
MRKLNYYILKQLRSWRNHLDLMIYGTLQIWFLSALPCIVLVHFLLDKKYLFLTVSVAFPVFIFEGLKDPTALTVAIVYQAALVPLVHLTTSRNLVWSVEYLIWLTVKKKPLKYVWGVNCHGFILRDSFDPVYLVPGLW